MDKKKNREITEKEEKDMALALKKDEITLQEMLDVISSDAKFLSGKDNMIELDPDNSFHREWFEEDK